jgi:glycosyltransferase involved in cell wall biosynthesis
MRIAVFHNLPPGGGKRAALEWIKRLSILHEIDLYLYDSRAEESLDIRPYINKTYYIGEVKTSSNGLFYRLLSLIKVFFLSRKIAYKIEKLNYDLVIVFQCRISNSPFVLRFIKTNNLYICHEPLTRMLEPHYPVRWKRGILSYIIRLALFVYIYIDKVNATKAKYIYTSSMYSKECIYKAYGVYPFLIYPGVDIQKFKATGDVRRKTILSVGSLIPSKGHDFVIKSVATITKEERPNIFIIYTSDHYRINYKLELKKLAFDLDVVVDFKSQIDDSELVRLYNSAMVTACSNLLEPLGLVALESMACGTPVVGVAEAGIRETVQHNENGLLTERNPFKFGEAILLLMNDNTLWNKFSTVGKQRVEERWTWNSSTENLNEIIIQITQ